MIHGYVRVSTEDQARDGRSSLEDQERRIRAVASLRDLEPTSGAEITVWSDRGVSGGIPLSSRPEGFRMLESLDRGDLVIAAKLDRLFRSAEDALSQSRRWRDDGIELILTDMGTEPVTTSATGRLYFGMLAQFAEFERARIAERIGDGKAAKRARGGFTGGNAPIGFKINGQGPSATLVPDEAEREMLQIVRDLAPILKPTALANELNRRGFRSRAGTEITGAQAWRWSRLL